MARRRSKRGGTLFTNILAVVFGLLFSCAGIGVFYLISWTAISGWWAAQSWEPTACTILDSRVGEHRSSKGSDTYSIDVEYAYAFGGREYRSDRYNFFGGSSSGRNGKQAVVDQLFPGLQTTCYVDPADPASAVLNRDWSWTYAIGCIFLFTFTPIGLVVAFSIFSRGKRVAQLPHGPQLNPGPSTYAANTGPRMLESTVTPGKTLAGALVFTIVWYAILGAVGWGFLQDGFSFANIIPIAIVSVMALGGLIGVAGVVRGFLGLWNPRVRLSMAPADLRLGATAELAWELSGDVSRLTSFKLYLQGRESATYRRGTDTSTDHSIFEKITIAQATAQADMRMGKVDFAMPEFTMPTLDLPNNKIQWVLRVEGSIPNWPDVEEEFPVNVLPLALPGTGAASEAPHA